MALSGELPCPPGTVMHRTVLLWRLIARTLVREPQRLLITTLCVALGVAVVVAIDLAGEAAAGSFESSMESLRGSAAYEISQVGGVADSVFGNLARLPYPLEFSARVEGFATVEPSGERVPFFGVDLLGDPNLQAGIGTEAPALEELSSLRAVWVSRELVSGGTGSIELVINDRLQRFSVQGVLDPREGEGYGRGNLVVMDIALAQRVAERIGRLDRIYVHESGEDGQNWLPQLQAQVPSGASVRPAGARTAENRKLLRSFRWNLEVLSYIALIVGAFLIYNTVTASVVRRRTLIGVARAVGMPAGWVRAGFLAEGCLFGILGTLAGLALGRVLAGIAVELMGQTVESLYVTSSPGEIAFGPLTLLKAVGAGVGVSALAAWWPAAEASAVSPTEAMASGRSDYRMLQARRSWLKAALVCGLLSALLCALPAWDRIPVGGFLGAVGLILASAMVIPELASRAFRAAGRPLLRVLGPMALIGSRSLSGSIERTSVIVAALATATAMTVSVAIMVGSLRETLIVWMDGQLQADLYIQPEARDGPEATGTFSEEVAESVERMPSVAAVDRLRRYPISFQSLPATLALADFRVHSTRSAMRFLGGSDAAEVYERLVSSDSVIVSEAFGNKHGLQVGDTIRMPIGDGREPFEVAGIYADYSSESGYVFGHREVLMRYLPDPRLTGVAVYAEPGADIEVLRSDILAGWGDRRLRVARNGELREAATEIFDRTFAITYALEAVAVFVAILGMAGALLTLVLDRRTELGVLRAVGATRRQVKRLVLVQAGLLGLAANAAGCVLGVALSVVLIKVLNKQSFGWTIQFHWPVGLLLGALAVILGAAVAAGTYPALIAASREPSDAIRGE